MRGPVAFIGHSGSGKTSLIVALVARCARSGERVAVIKHTHHDPARREPRGDSERYLEAGAVAVVLAGHREAVVMVPDKPPEPRRFESAAEIPRWLDADRIFVEGFKSLGVWPRILVERVGVDPVRPIPDVAAIVSDSDETFERPRFRHDDIDGIHAFLDRLSDGNG